MGSNAPPSLRVPLSIGIKVCVDCKDIKATCKPLPQVAVQSLIAALATADAVDDKDEQSVHVFTTAITNCRRKLKAEAVTMKEASTAPAATTAPVAETVPLAKLIPSAMSSPDYASEFLEIGRRIADALEAIHHVKKARWDSEQQEEEDAEYIPSDSE
ncbi:hypothetical protein PFICI_05992 [Pestalotiopsis fici W106-1]|uniref:Uncharacterized protein n=1 Tax=Pestalotiopsis fici (strain W106-1 / CGMCC3.15140) TaxID=1229662 RepID=W3X4K1_PESFW|nr:uncharacterized protein PFICI_05992 [Pestalotiopsis fici W106-1]ETS80990.1 hypothetical protein PFICI_05992 [Pestalotiopsis fici W106-1]